jgi:ribosome-associated heat shock protein Hsp15
MTDDADKDDGGAPVRLDKWLWAARFFKTRSLAARAVALGQVQLNGARTKPAREVRIDDLLQIELESSRRTVRVRGVLAARQPASIAQTLYAETEESLQARNKEQERKRLYREPALGQKGRPEKRVRRQLVRLTER